MATIDNNKELMNQARVDEKPLKMPEGYDFSTKNVDWGKYKQDYLLRTDAVWEKSKLMAYFYSVYKAPRLHYVGNKYYELSIEYDIERLDDIDTTGIWNNIPNDDEAIRPFTHYGNGAPWMWDLAPKVNQPLRTSIFLGDRSKDMTFLCMLKFHKFMRCNEKSTVKLTEANLMNGTYNDYKCYEELNELYDWCIMFHMKVLFEMYHYRVYNNYFKPISHHRIGRGKDIFHTPGNPNLYY